MATLLALQTLELENRKAAKDADRARLRAEVPEPVLGHFDRLLARGKKGVSVIRNGVCTECHIRVPVGTLVTLARGADIQLCGNCGRYLHLPDEELPSLRTAEKPVVTKAPARRPRRRRGNEELTVA